MRGVIGEIKLRKLLTQIIPAIQEITGEYSTTTTKPVTVMEIAEKTRLSSSIVGKAILQVGETLFHLETTTTFRRHERICRHIKAVYLHF